MLFREKSLEKLSSPEHLNEYMRVTSVPIWLILVAIMFLLFGFCMWAVLGHLETTITMRGNIQNHQWNIQTKEVKAYELELGMMLVCEDVIGTIKTIQMEDDITVIKGEIPKLPDGMYTCTITTEAITPISFLWN